LLAAHEKEMASLQAARQQEVASLKAARQQEVGRLQQEMDRLRAELARSQALKARIHGAAGSMATMLGHVNDFVSIIHALKDDAGPLNSDD
jgi:uncharacterized protein with PhoU and TrkA domain